jgi:hypothetical protein
MSDQFQCAIRFPRRLVGGAEHRCADDSACYWRDGGRRRARSGKSGDHVSIRISVPPNSLYHGPQRNATARRRLVAQLVK